MIRYNNPAGIFMPAVFLFETQATNKLRNRNKKQLWNRPAGTVN